MARSVTGSAAFESFEAADIEQSIPDRFARQVERHAGRLAVATDERSLTYEELDGEANRVANRILGARNERAEPAVVLLPPGIASIVAVLGALKATRFYVPLDPSHPAERLDWTLGDVGAELLLADSESARLAESLAARRGLDLVLVDSLGGESTRSPRCRIPAEALAYVFYTSGSTGQPKGVVDTHRNVLHNIMRYTNRLRIGPDDRLTLVQAPSFSGSVSSLFGALLNGAAVFPFDLREEGIGGLRRCIAEQGLTIYHSVPAIFRGLVDRGELPSLRFIRLEGDQATPADAELFKASFGRDTVLVNGLGATECGIVRQLFVTHETELTTDTLPVGYPVTDMDVVVVGADGAEVPRGEVGEIVVRSRYLSPGYWNRPELTAAAFVGESGAERAYHTGDLGRMHADGCLEHLGRLDFQGKVRGHRIEASAVEAALVRSGLASEAAVTVRSTPDGDGQAIAFLVPAERPPPTPARLRAVLAETVPEATIPSRYVHVEALPLTESGKIDRAALHGLDLPRDRVGGEYLPPRNRLERQLVALWEELLDVRPIGVRDSFLDLGGDSLRAATLHARLEEVVGRELPFSLLAGSATIEELGRGIAGNRSGPDESVVPIQAGGAGTPFFFAHGDFVGGGAYCSGLARELGRDRSIHVVEPPRLRHEGSDVPSLRALAAERVAAIRLLQPSGPYLLGGGGDCAAGGLLAFEIARQLSLAGERIALLALVGTRPSNSSVLARLLEHSISGVGPLVGIGPRRRTELFLRIRALYERLRTPGHRRSRPIEEAIERVEPPGTDRGGLERWYRRLEHAYVPRRFGGRLTLLWPEGERGVSPRELERVWGRLAGEVQLIAVPGDLSTALEGATAEIGRELRRLLSDADSRVPLLRGSRIECAREDSNPRPAA